MDAKGVDSKLKELLLKGDICYNSHLLDSALYFYNSVLKSRDIREFSDERCDAYTRIAGVFIDLKDFKKSNQYLDSSFSLFSAKTVVNKNVLFRYYVKKGKLSFYENKFQQSVKSLNNAKEFISKFSDDTLFVDFELYSAVSNYMIGERQKASKVLDKLLTVGKPYREKYSNELMYALFYKVFYLTDLKGNCNININKYIDIADLIILDNNDKSAKSLGYLYQITGNIFIQARQYEKGLQYLRKAKESYSLDLHKYEKEILYVLTDEGRCYYETGDYSKAKRYLLESMKIDSSKAFFSENEKCNILIKIGITYKYLENYQEALYTFNKVLNKKEILNGISLTSLYLNIASTYAKLNDLKNALKYFQLAIDYRIKNIPDDKLNLARSYHNYGEYCLLSKDYNKSDELFKKSLDLFKLLNEKGISVARLYSTMGKLALAQEKNNAALDCFQKSINELCSKPFNPEEAGSWNSQKMVSAKDLLIAIKQKAALYSQIAKNEKVKDKQIKEYQNSLNCYKAAVWVTDTIRGGFQLDDSKLSLAESEKEIYTNAMEVAYHLCSLTGKSEYVYLAFEFSERSKSSLLLSNMQESDFAKNGTVPKNISNKLRSLKYNISKLEYLVDHSGNSAYEINHSYELAMKLFELYGKQEELLSEVNKKYPQYNSRSYRPAIKDAKTVMQSLTKDDLLIEYTLSDNILYSFVVSQNNVSMTRKDLPLTFREDVNSIYKSCSEYNTNFSDFSSFNNFTATSNRLYNILLSDTKGQLKNKKLIFVPDEILCFLPFETLIDKLPVTKSTDYLSLSYLVKSNPISYANSATILFNSANKVTPAKNELLAFAPVYKPDHSNLIAALVTRSALVPIAGAKEEVFGIEKLMNGKVLADETATESEFKRIAGDYKVIHLAMHCVADSVDPENSVLVFGNGGKEDDGLLHEWEIAAMNLNSSLAVLSACNTGMGKLSKGEGVLNIARAFFDAGCPSVVMTLWEVGDLSSTNLMSSFYNYLSEGYSKNSALQQAKLDYISASDPLSAHPYFWAGYITVGNTDPTDVKFPKKNYVMIFSTSTLLILTLVIVKRRKRKNNQV